MQEKSSLNPQNDSPQYDVQNINTQNDNQPKEESLAVDPQKLDFYSKSLKIINEIKDKIIEIRQYIEEHVFNKEISTNVETIPHLEMENSPALTEEPTTEEINMREDENQGMFKSLEKAYESAQLELLWSEIAPGLLLEDKIAILNVAIINKHQGVTEFLLEKTSKEIAFDNIRDISTLLIDAGDKETLDFWFTQMKELGKISATKGIKYHAQAAHTAIISAYEKGDKEIIDFIVNCQDVLKNMGTALNLAVVKKEKSTVDSLLTADSYIENPEHKIEAKYKGKALGAAVRTMNEDMLNDLMEKVGDDISVKDKATAIGLSKKIMDQMLGDKIKEEMSEEELQIFKDLTSLGEIIMEKMSEEELLELKDLTLTLEFSGINELVDNFYYNKYERIAEPERKDVEREDDKDDNNFDNVLFEEENSFEDTAFSNESSNILGVVGDNKHQVDEL